MLTFVLIYKHAQSSVTRWGVCSCVNTYLTYGQSRKTSAKGSAHYVCTYTRTRSCIYMRGRSTNMEAILTSFANLTCTMDIFMMHVRFASGVNVECMLRFSRQVCLDVLVIGNVTLSKWHGTFTHVHVHVVRKSMNSVDCVLCTEYRSKASCRRVIRVRFLGIFWTWTY